MNTLLDAAQITLAAKTGTGGLMGKLLEHERKFWLNKLRRTSETNDEAQVIGEAFQRTLARIRLGASPRDESETIALLEQEPTFAAWEHTRKQGTALAMQRAYPGSNFLGTMQPDKLGEHLTRVALEGPHKDTILEYVFDPARIETGLMRPEEGLTTLARLTTWANGTEAILEHVLLKNLHLAKPALLVAGQGHQVIQKIYHDALMLEPRLPGLALAVSDGMPVYNTELLHLSEISTQIAVNELRETDDKINLSRLLNTLGMRLSNREERQKALTTTQEAVDLYRELARDNPQTFNSELAMSLNNLGIWLGNLGRREEALKATLNSVDLFRELAQDFPLVHDHSDYP